MRLSEKGYEFIREWEGFSATPYPDGWNNGVQLYSIGYGHQIKPNEQYLMEGVTRTKAAELMQSDVWEVERCINNNVNVSLSQNEFDALGSFVFNLGCPRFSGSTLLKKLNDGKKSEAALQLKRWIYQIQPDGTAKKIPHNVRRRDAEYELFTSENYNSEEQKKKEVQNDNCSCKPCVSRTYVIDRVAIATVILKLAKIILNYFNIKIN